HVLPTRLNGSVLDSHCMGYHRGRWREVANLPFTVLPQVMGHAPKLMSRAGRSSTAHLQPALERLPVPGSVPECYPVASGLHQTRLVYVAPRRVSVAGHIPSQSARESNPHSHPEVHAQTSPGLNPCAPSRGP